jgi:phosphatidylserine decarboxylase
VVKQVQYQKGKFGNAMGDVSSENNEQNIVTVEGEGQTIVFKQIAGLLARRIVFSKQVGDTLTRGERIGLIKFGSRVDVLLHPDVKVLVKVGDNVAGGSSVIAQSETAAQSGVKA